MTALRKGANEGASLSRQNPGRLAGASGTITIAQFFPCDPSRYFLSRSSAAWLPTGSKAPFFERDTRVGWSSAPLIDSFTSFDVVNHLSTFAGVETKSNISFAGLSITVWFSTKTTLVLSPIAETKAGGVVCADAGVAAAITPKPNKGKNRCFINLSLGMLLSFFSCLAI